MKVIKVLIKFLPERGADTMSAQQSLDHGWEIDCVSVGCPRGLEREMEGFGKHETIPVSQGLLFSAGGFK
jgi:hypothetical protein